MSRKIVLFALCLSACEEPERERLGMYKPERLRLADGRVLTCKRIPIGPSASDLSCEGGVYVFNAVNFELAAPLPVEPRKDPPR